MVLDQVSHRAGQDAPNWSRVCFLRRRGDRLGEERYDEMFISDPPVYSRIISLALNDVV
jgi:hypothetical protein